jgi:hypothetical protein
MQAAEASHGRWAVTITALTPKDSAALRVDASRN